MANPTTRTQFKDYCLRRLGHPVIQINVDDDQVEDRIDDALQFFHDYHFDGVEKIFMKHKISQQDIDRGWIYCPEPVLFVSGVMPFDSSSASVNMFDLRYQLRLNDLYDFTSVSYVSYEITMQHINTLNMLFSGIPQFRFNRHLDKLHLDINWAGGDLKLGEYVIIECYRKLDPDTFTGRGTVATTADSVVVTGSGTNFYADFLIGDEISIGDSTAKIKVINSETSMNVVTAMASTTSGQSVTRAGISDVWNDRFLKQYATAKIKYQWGSNLSKFAGIQMPGGVTLDGPRIMQEAQTEIDKIEEEMQSYNVLPSSMMIG